MGLQWSISCSSRQNKGHFFSKRGFPGVPPPGPSLEMGYFAVKQLSWVPQLLLLLLPGLPREGILCLPPGFAEWCTGKGFGAWGGRQPWMCMVTSRRLSDTHCCCPNGDMPIRVGPCPHTAYPSQSQPIFWLPTSLKNTEKCHAAT